MKHIRKILLSVVISLIIMLIPMGLLITSDNYQTAEAATTATYRLTYNYTKITKFKNNSTTETGTSSNLSVYVDYSDSHTAKDVCVYLSGSGTNGSTSVTDNNYTFNFPDINLWTSERISSYQIIDNNGKIWSSGEKLYQTLSISLNLDFNKTYTLTFVTEGADIWSLGTYLATEQIVTYETTFTIKKDPPTGTLYGVTNGGITKNNVSFTWADSSATAKLDGKNYTSNTSISSEGPHTIILTDAYGQSATYTFTIDKTAPAGTFTGVSDGGYTNQNVVFTWTETDATAVLNGNTYYSNQTVSEEGTYTLVLTDVVGNSATYTFTIDKTAPIGTLTGVSDGGYTNKNVKFTWTDNEASAKLNGSGYSSGVNISAERKYTLVLTDLAGNSTTYTFTIDKTAPTGTLDNVSNDGYTNKDVTFAWTDNEASAKLNGSNYSSGDSISSECKYTLVLTDLAGNSTTYTFTIDKTAPIGTLDNVADGGYTNKNVKFAWTDSEASAKLNGSVYSSGTNISAERKHTIVLTDLASNSTTYTFTIDKTAPVGTLDNVADGGYTNKNVKFSWTDSEASAKLNGSNYSSGDSISSECKYTLVLTDLAGNSTTYTFTIDKTAPTGTLDNVADGGYTNKNVKFAWTDNEASAKLNGAEYISGRIISNENIYTLVLADLAGNSTTYTFTIDKTVPVIEMTIADGKHTNNDVVVNYYDTGTAVSALYGKTENKGYVSAVSDFQSGRKFITEGNYTVKAIDAAGNSTELHFTIDKSSPVIDAYSAYTNAAFTLTAKDNYGEVSAWEYRLNSEEIRRHVGGTATIGGGAESNGVWSVRVIDELGNTSKWETINFVSRKEFGNSEIIFNSFFVPSYYVVTLSQKNYTSCFGAYTFADYSAALSFAINKEWECRVIELDGGKSWNYVNQTNENTRQIYTDRAELDEVIDKYARKNIGDRKVMSKNGAALNNPTDGSGVTRTDALTRQITALPELLSAYSDYRYMLALPSYSLKLPQTIVDGNKATATIQFISDGISLRSGAEKALSYGDKISTTLNAEGEQGWYLITERDVCGNVEKYLIFVDVQQPDFYVNVTFGDGNKELINFNQSYIEENTETMRFIEFDVSSLSDNIDDYVMLSVDGRNLSSQYVWGDELPVLNFENGYYGAYKIMAYDRSRNVLEFTVYIAGEDPSLKHSSLNNETACTFTVQVNDSFNEITDIKFFKIHFEGTEERIYADSYDTPINAQTLIYKINVGGKYVFEFSDLYGRTVRTNPIFYMKGLPSVTLRGVKDGGLTKNDVSIVYDSDDTCVLYTFLDGEWNLTMQYEVTQGISTNTIGITAGRETTAIYKILLYKTDDRNLFTEYTFEIDGIPPEVQICTDSGADIMPGTVTTQDFYLTWQESGYKVYYKKQGAISDMTYSRDAVITSAGSYVFTVYDLARNELTFNVTLDNDVSYTLDGAYTLLEDGSYITRSSFVFTVTEPYSAFNVDASNGLSVLNGQKLDTDGTYLVKVKDMYSNEMSLKLIIDKLPPVPVVRTESGETLESGARTTEAFRVLCEEANVTITFAYGNEGFAAYDGAAIDAQGTYTFRLVDRVGNTTTLSVTIDREVTYRIDGTYIEFDGAYHSKTWLMVVPTETVTQLIIETKEGSLFDVTKRISEEGIYNVQITDVAGNKAVFTLVIDKTAPLVQIVTESGSILNGKEKTNETFKFVCDEDGAMLVYSYEGSSNINYDGDWIIEPGSYVYTVTDKLGNSATGVIVIEREVQFRIDGSYTIFDNNYCSRSWLLIIPLEEVSLFIIEDETGGLIDTDKRITAEGNYTVTITDIADNTVKLKVIIDKTAPVAKIITESGKELNGGAVNEPFKAICDDTDASVEVAMDSGKFSAYDGSLISDEGLYTFRFKDRVGNSSEISIFVNYDVLYTVEGSFVFSGGKYYSKSWLLVSPQEDISDLIIEDENGNLFDATKRISEEGNYKVTITDIAGNKISFQFVIDRTAPTIRVISESGREVINGAVNESFKIVCDEPDVKINYVYDGDSAISYENELLTETGKYIFNITDIAGNVASVAVTIDREVLYSIDGEYKLYDNKYQSKSWLLVTPNEETVEFTIEDSEGNLIDTVKRITVEGAYTVVITDVAGNREVLTLVIDKTAPTLQIIIESGLKLVNGSSTKEPIKVICAENDSSITYDFNGAAFVTYSGAWISEHGKYIFYVSDFLGNTSEQVINIDTIVMLTVNGTYVIDFDGNIISRNWLSVTPDEELKTFNILSVDGTNFDVNSRITEEGVFKVRAEDKCGNVRELTLVIDKTAPGIVFDGVIEGGSTKDTVMVNFTDYTEAYYRFNSGDKITIVSGAEFELEGSYLIAARDLVGNTVIKSFQIDKHVDVVPSIDLADGCFITGSVSFRFDEDVSAKLYRDGEEITYLRGEIAKIGEYRLDILDGCGNQEIFMWGILPAKAREYSLRVLPDFDVLIELNGEVASALFDGEMLKLSETGHYVLLFNSSYSSCTLELDVDNIAPEVMFESTRTSVKIFNPNKDGLTYTLYCNGQKSSFSMNNSAELTQTGNYRLICEDEVGNVTEYEFTLNYLSDISIVLIAVVCSLVIGGITALLILRFRKKIF